VSLTNAANSTLGAPTSAQITILRGATFSRLYLPAALLNHVSYFPGPFEIEPNNTAAQANGPLQSAVNYQGYPNDDKDYFSFFLPRTGNITADMAGNTGVGPQLLLYYQIADVAHRVDFVAGSPFHIAKSNQPAGWYYLEVYTAGGFNSSTPYSLQVTYP
jgi:hypothetical protein